MEEVPFLRPFTSTSTCPQWRDAAPTGPILHTMLEVADGEKAVVKKKGCTFKNKQANKKNKRFTFK